MKTLFFIAALAGAVYLIMQTPAGQAWLQESEPELEIQQTAEKVHQVSTQVAQNLENTVTELAQDLTQKQQVQIDQLEDRIAELENELIMGRVAQKQQSMADGVVTLHPYNQPEAAKVNTTNKQNVDINAAAPEALAAASNNQLQRQRQRQARLQDIADRMEMSSLQALVN
ncbi:DUF2730 domain-containing protein [uncultured Paraglaciecola sp.]|uniref:DUF2730 domain-containing protein n=1 Tax=uncultured Paraglaciecola sp. TaxID=1765024 RepID=UPI0030D75B87|tara:strand:- start:34528 stop:35040 length:513 start_codon:yes stop_codon:yes gene_type:complete